VGYKVLKNLSVSALLALSGCYGFDSSGVTDSVEFPTSYLTRLVGDSPSAEYDLCDSVGQVGTLTAGVAATAASRGRNPAFFRSFQVTKRGAPEPKTVIIPGQQSIKYEDVVTNGNSQTGSYAVLGVNQSTDRAASVRLSDVAACKMTASSIPIQRLLQLSNLPPGEYVYVYGAVLSLIDGTVGSKQSAGATLAGAAFAAGGKVYAGRQARSQRVVIGLDYIPINELLAFCAGTNREVCINNPDQLPALTNVPPAAPAGPAAVPPP
jgi:hypothetical protein